MEQLGVFEDSYIPCAQCDEEDEVWAPYRGDLLDLFEVSTHGRVRERGGRIRPAYHDKQKYRRIDIRIAGKRLVRKPHRMVLHAFVGPKPEGLVARHLDDNKEHNHLGNLKYGTPRENMVDKVRVGRDNSIVKTVCPRGHLLLWPNLVVDQLKRGARSCYSCAVAHQETWVKMKRAGTKREAMETRADELYAELMRSGEPGNELHDKLVELDYDRWVSWTKELLSRCARRADGALVIPSDYTKALEAALVVPYSEVSEIRRTERRNEIDHYWELIEEAERVGRL